MPDLVGGLWLVAASEPMRLSNSADENATAVQFTVNASGQLEITPVSGEPIHLGAGLTVDGAAEFLSDVTIDGGAHVIGNVGIGAAIVATARLLLAAGSASLAPLAFSAGTLLTFPVSGRVEYDGAAYYATVGTDRQKLVREPGSTAITTLGTIGTGVWQATPVAAAYLGAHTHAAADVTSGTFADARISQSSVTQHQAALSIAYTQLTGVVPTWNQNTTGSAAKWTTARLLAGNLVDGSADVAFANKVIVQGTVDAGLSGAQFLGALSTGIVKNTTTTGVLSIAVAGDFPTLNQNTTGSAATLTTIRTIWGQNFNGSADVNGAFSGATTMTWSGNVLNDLLFTDATYDIGASGATRPRDLFLSRHVKLPSGSNIYLDWSSGQAIIKGLTSRIDITADAGGSNVRILGGQTQFVDMDINVSTGHQFGFGTGASFQGLKSSGSGSSTDYYVQGTLGLAAQINSGKVIVYTNHSASDTHQMTSGFTAYGFGSYLSNNATGDSNQTYLIERDSVAHGMTDVTGTDTILFMRTLTGSKGGTEIVGVSNLTKSLGLTAYGVTDVTAHTNADNAYALVNVAKRSGTSVAAAGAGANLLAIRNNGTNVYLFDADGTMWSFGSVTSQYGLNAVVGGTLTVASLTGILRADAGVVSVSAGVGARSIFDHFADANNGTTVETDLYSDTLAAGRLAANGEKVTAQYGGTFVGDATSSQRIRVYFGGTLIFDSGAIGVGVTALDWDIKVTIVRESASIVRCSTAMASDVSALGGDAKYTKVTGLTLANTQILKITGQAAGATAASNQITASEGYVEWLPAAA